MIDLNNNYTVGLDGKRYWNWLTCKDKPIKIRKVKENEEDILRVEESSANTLFIQTDNFLYIYQKQMEKQKIETEHFYFGRLQKTAFFVKNNQLCSYNEVSNDIETI